MVSKSSLFWKLFSSLLGFAIELSLIIAAVGLYGSSLMAHSSDTLAMLDFISTNNCSDGPLQKAFIELAQNYTRQYAVTRLGLAFSLFSLLFTLGSFLLLSEYRKFVYKFKDTKDEDERAKYIEENQKIS